VALIFISSTSLLLLFPDPNLARFDDQQMARELIIRQISEPFHKLAVHFAGGHLIWEARYHNAEMTPDGKMQDIAEPQIACYQYGTTLLGKLKNSFIVRPAKSMISNVLNLMPK